jgi:hypothetical protein
LTNCIIISILYGIKERYNMTYWFVNVDGKWSKPFTYYPVAKFNSTKKDVKIYEVNLDELPKKTLVWKSKI